MPRATRPRAPAPRPHCAARLARPHRADGADGARSPSQVMSAASRADADTLLKALNEEAAEPTVGGLGGLGVGGRVVGVSRDVEKELRDKVQTTI